MQYLARLRVASGRLWWVAFSGLVVSRIRVVAWLAWHLLWVPTSYVLLYCVPKYACDRLTAHGAFPFSADANSQSRRSGFDFTLPADSEVGIVTTRVGGINN